MLILRYLAHNLQVTANMKNSLVNIILPLKSLFILLILFTPRQTLLIGQVDTVILKKQMLGEAYKMGQSIKNRQYDEFVTYLYPPTVEFLGGKEKVADAIASGFSDSYNIVSINYSNAGPIHRENEMYQCVITQEIVVQISQGTVTTESAVIGFSESNNDKWYFIDSDGKRLEELRRRYPFLSENLYLPATGAPIFHMTDTIE